MASRSNRSAKEAEATVTGVPLEPIRVVERELTSPDGTKVKVKVPVYPPFQLASAAPASEPQRPTRAPRARQRQRGRTSG